MLAGVDRKSAGIDRIADGSGGRSGGFDRKMSGNDLMMGGLGRTTAAEIILLFQTGQVVSISPLLRRFHAANGGA